MITRVGKVLRQIRLNNDEVLKDMAEKLGVSSAFLSAVENGKKKMPKRIRNALIKKYKLSNEEVINLDNAIYESNDSVEINIQSLSDAKKGLAVEFARSFGELSDIDIEFFTKYLKNRSKKGD